MEQCNVNRKLLPLKVHYFLIYGAQAAFVIFLSVYPEHLGISVGVAGIFFAVMASLTLVSNATFGGIVDHFQNLKQVLLFLILIYIAADLGLNFIPKPYQTPVNITGDNIICNEGNSYIIDCGETDCQLELENSSTGCSISCSLCQYDSVYCLERNETKNTELDIYNSVNSNLKSTMNSTAILKKCLNDKDIKCTDACFDGSDNCKSIVGTNPPLQLWLWGIFATLGFLAITSILSLSDAACYNALSDEPQNYGRQRIWGTIGSGTFGLLAGYLNQVFTGASKIYSYAPAFYMLVIIFAIDLIVITKLRLKDVIVSKNIFKDVGNLLVKPRIILFLIGVYGSGMITGFSRVYLFWYLRTTLGASQLILGCLSGIQCFVGQLPFFFFSGLILSKLGHINTFTMSFLAYGLRFLSHSSLTNPWMALPIEILEGPCFGSFYAAMTSYSKMISPEGTEATMQGIVSGAYVGLGGTTGCLLGGFCLSNFGGRETFYWMGLISFGTGIIHWLVHLIKDWKYRGVQNPIEMSGVNT